MNSIVHTLKRPAVYLPMGILAIFAICFAWLSFDADRTQWMQARVQKALRMAVGDMIQVVPRQEVIDAPQAPHAYYVPDTNYLNAPGTPPTPAAMPSPAYDASLRGARLIVYRDVLINLSQDSRMPLFKLTLAHPIWDPGVGIQATATLSFQEVGGITKQITVGCYVPEPLFKHATGSAVYGWADSHGTLYASRVQIPLADQC